MHHLWKKSICDKQIIHSIQCNHIQSCNSICSCRRHYYHYCSSERLKLFQQRHRRPLQSFKANSRNSRISSSSSLTNDDGSSLTLSQSRHHSVNTSHSKRILRARQQRIRRNRFKSMCPTFEKIASATTKALNSTQKHHQWSTYFCNKQCNTSIS